MRCYVLERIDGTYNYREKNAVEGNRETGVRDGELCHVDSQSALYKA